ncbi:peptidylprolyl isomerase [Mucilaginibacter terrenus]|uniref:Periplasmic chaperone PpiD n=1 Tax=Mucilaginibacter terrenus TaxID=2482727 RepID=A0A3E2NLK7_9SPHI|nr:peptidylprolyl isomerase [Mucilaginibacter terrenus]RFZ81790.1 peptidylprolyl isomerase [Mucilaginibacter terrenus]
MGIMSYLRERMGKILAIVIGLALLGFVAEEVIKSGSSIFRDNQTDIGEVNGSAISYNKFNQRLDIATNQFKQQGQSISPQITSYLQETTWNQFLTEKLLGKEIEKLGLVVGDAEIQSMVSGSNPDPQIARQFSDPQTGQFDRARLNQFLTYIQSNKADTAQLSSWAAFVSEVIKSRTQQKYVSLVSNGLYINSLEAQDEYQGKNKLANFKYAVLDYASIPDNKVTPTDDDFNAYYNEHKNEFKNKEELRNINYVSFNAAPSKADSAAIKVQVDKLAADFKASTNDSLFVQVNSETKTPIAYVKKGRLDPQLDSVMFNAEKGFTYGPYLSNGSYKIAKLIDTKVGPDSVKARHILLDPAAEGGLPRAQAKADSLKALIQSGKATFADLAKKFSTDKQSGTNGGDLPTFGRGAMIPVFEDAAFDGKQGDMKIVTSQFGVHLIEIQSQKGSSKVVKVAQVDKPLEASEQTQNAVYNKAQAFLSSLNKDNFEAEAKKAGLSVKNAFDITGTAAVLPGLENARALVKWAFKADKGDFSEEVYPIGDQYVVARLAEIKPVGFLSLDAVKAEITPAVKIRVKAKQLTDKFQSALSGASSIDQVAQKAGTKAVSLQNIVFANPVIPGAAAEYKVIGTVFGLQPNKLSKPIDGVQGVYVVSLDSFVNPAPATNLVREKQTLAQTLEQRAGNQVLEALKDKAIVKDNRAKFL